MNQFDWTPSRDFRPHPLLRGGTLQTVFVAMQSTAAIPYSARQSIIDTTDGDRLVVHDDCPPSWQPGDPWACLVHGLGGCHGSPYNVRATDKLTRRGIRVFRMDMRGCGAGLRLAQKPGHAGRSEDVAAVVQFVTSECPSSPLSVVGYSLGANIVLKWLGEKPSRIPTNVVRAMAVAAPVDLLACSQHIERTRMFFYNRWFVRMLMAHLTHRREFMPELATLQMNPSPGSLFAFDDRVTAPLSGYSGAHEYYQRSSSAQFLRAIRIPTVILAAADDPIVPAEMFRHIDCSNSVALHIAPSGGHVGFFGRQNGDPDRYWLDWRVVEYICGES